MPCHGSITGAHFNIKLSQESMLFRTLFIICFSLLNMGKEVTLIGYMGITQPRLVTQNACVIAFF